MPITKLSEKRTPIKIEQTTLIKFFPQVSALKKRRMGRNLRWRKRFSPKTDYTLKLEREYILKIKETHCLKCGSRLIRNGWNPRLAILDRGLGKLRFRIERKLCPKCGEIKPDYSKFAPRFGNYHENFKRRARQHYMEGLMPSQIKRVFKIDFDVSISKSTIVNWINDVAKPLRDTLRDTPVPSSGYWGYDEIHMLIGGKKMYTIDTVDVNTRFVPVARITSNMGRNEGKKVLNEGKRGRNLKINGLVKDCTTNLGGLFRTRSFKHIKQQNCLTHVKWIVSKHVKAYTGLPSQSKKPVPKEWLWLLKRFYALIDSTDETDAYIKLEIIRRTVERLNGKRKKHLITALKHMESWFPKIIAHQRDPNMPTTNNLLESYHKKYNYYPSFKRNMMTAKGAQRVLDYRVFRHNYRRFPLQFQQYEKKYENYQLLLKDPKEKAFLRGQGMYFKHERLKLERWYGNYQRLWDQYLAVI